MFTDDGLAQTPPGRVETVAEQVVDLDADVVCLQEIFTPDEIEYMTGEMESAGYEVYVDYLQVTTDEFYLPCSQ